MNPIEHLWDEIGRKIRTHNVKNMQQLKNAILTEWNAIDPEITKKLEESFYQCYKSKTWFYTL